MTFLTTLYSSPHSSFHIINREYLYTTITDIFEINVEDVDLIKDLINMYSYVLAGQPGTNAFYAGKTNKVLCALQLEIPLDGDIVNAAISLVVKLKRHPQGYITQKAAAAITITDIYEEQFIEDILNVSILENEVFLARMRMSEYADIVQVSPVTRLFPDFKYKLVTKAHIATKTKSREFMESYLYVDYSMSMFSEHKILKILYGSVKFTDDTHYRLHIYSVTSYGISFKGVATTQKQLQDLLFKEAIFEVGKIDHNKVIEHSNTHECLSSFITDGDDFLEDDFIKKTNKFNLISISDGKVIKT